MADDVARRSRPQVMVATEDDGLGPALADLLSPEIDVVMVPPVPAAVSAAVMAQAAAAALVIDGRIPGGVAWRMASEFVAATPASVAVVLVSADDSDSLLRRAHLSDPRIEVMFHPWNDSQVRTFLLHATRSSRLQAV